MIVIPNDETIHSLLANNYERFKIPSYQRRYAWKNPQHSTFFKDLDMLLPNEGHLFGMLILHTGSHQGGINDVYLVDGQQRFTTLSILLLVLKEKFEEVEDNFHVQQILLKLYCGDPNESDDPKLVLGELDNPDYLSLLKGNLEDIENQKILGCYMNLKKLVDDKFQEEGTDWLKNYYNTLNQRAKIIRLDVQQAKDAYKLFETINNRGLGLSATDVLKNFILGHAAKLSDEKLEVVKDLWTKLIITLDGTKSDDFFRQYISSLLTRKVTKNKLIEEFKKHYFKHVKEVDQLGEFLYAYGPLDTEEEDEEEVEEDEIDEINLELEAEDVSIERISIDEYLQKIVKTATTYKKITHRQFEDPKLNQKIKNLQAIKSITSYIFLMHYLGEEHPRNEMLKTLDMIGTLMLRRHIAGRSTSQNDDIFAKLLRLKREERKPNLIKDKLLADYPGDEEFKNSFPVHEFKPRIRERARFMLTKIEYYITGNTNELSINSAEDVHLEHIIPQKIHTKKSKQKFGDWQTYLGNDANLKHKKRKDRIGNLTLLAGDLNIIASNNPFKKKLECYEKSNIELTVEGHEYSPPRVISIPHFYSELSDSI
ncbi:MAG: DUF262 domain-containing HNH endonuclease family protein [Candidatus Paceibacterota bacterium]